MLCVLLTDFREDVDELAAAFRTHSTAQFFVTYRAGVLKHLMYVFCFIVSLARGQNLKLAW